MARDQLPDDVHSLESREEDDSPEGFTENGLDAIEDGCKLYPVFCIAKISLQIQDALVRQTRESFPPDGGACLCILRSADPEEHIRGSRVPAGSSVTAPFVGKSLAQLAELFRKEFAPRHPDWSQRAFAVLDEKSATDGKTIVLVTLEDADDEDYDDKGSDSGAKTESEAKGDAPCILHYRCEFGCSIDNLIAYEDGGLGMENDAADLIGTDKVFTVERFQGIMDGTWKGTPAEGDRMGKSYMGPEGTGRPKVR